MDLTNTINQLEAQINILEKELTNQSDKSIVNSYKRKLRNLKTSLSINIQQNKFKLYDNIDVDNIVNSEERSSYIE